MLGLHRQHEMSESNCSVKQNAVFGLDFLDIISKRNFVRLISSP